MKILIWYLTGGHMLGSIEMDTEGKPLTLKKANWLAGKMNKKAERLNSGESFLVKEVPEIRPEF